MDDTDRAVYELLVEQVRRSEGRARLVAISVLKRWYRECWRRHGNV